MKISKGFYAKRKRHLINFKRQHGKKREILLNILLPLTKINNLEEHNSVSRNLFVKTFYYLGFHFLGKHINLRKMLNSVINKYCFRKKKLILDLTFFTLHIFNKCKTKY